jgi:hypothetical protein
MYWTEEVFVSLVHRSLVQAALSVPKHHAPNVSILNTLSLTQHVIYVLLNIIFASTAIPALALNVHLISIIY